MRGLRRERLLMQRGLGGAAAEAVAGTRGAWAASRVGGAGGGWQREGGAEAADLGEEAVDVALVAGEKDVHARVLFLASAGPRHLAPLAVHQCRAIVQGLARPRVEHLLAHLVAARQRRRRIAAHLRTQPPAIRSKEVGLGRHPHWRCDQSSQRTPRPRPPSLSWAAAQAAAHAVRAGAPRHRGCRGNARGVWAASRV
eukprot:scaffold76866_cov56-Phaeocystis_antarctica.AAC.7